MDGVDCSDFANDAAGLEASRLATLESMNENMEDDEVAPGNPDDCAARRRLRYSNLVVSVQKRGLSESIVIVYTTTANINNLDYTDPTAAFDDIKSSLDSAISSGSYTSLVQSNGLALNSSTTSTVSVTALPMYSNITVFEVIPSGGGGGGGDDDDQTGIIVGAVIGSFVGLVLIIGCVYYFFFRENNDAFIEKRAQSTGSANSAHTTTVGTASGVKKAGPTLDEETAFQNPIFSEKKNGGKAADGYGGL